MQYSAEVFERNEDDETVNKWLTWLIAPGSPLDGARPKANILDEDRHPWIAKCSSKNDTFNKAAWEYLAYELAQYAGIKMGECMLQKVQGKYETFFTKRFDYMNGERIHFASAMTMTGHNGDTIKKQNVGYLDIAEFILNHGAGVDLDLQELWRRIVFNISVSNTDDHLRNHGFLLGEKGWRLSPAFDINPSVDKSGLAINIDTDNNALDFDLAKSVGEYFRLNENEMDKIITELSGSVSGWEKVATRLEISRSEKQMMEPAFTF